jgi:acetylornithine deacetylase
MPAEADVLDAIDESALVALASALVAIPSTSANESAAQAFVAGELRRIGAGVEQWDIDMTTLQAHPDYSAEFERLDAVGVMGRVGEGDPAAGVLVIDGHVDVVPPGDPSGWRVTQPFSPCLRAGALYGRGACDTKGGLAAALHAIDAIGRAGVPIAGEVRLTSVVGEEDGGSGTLAAVLAGVFNGASGCVVLEPTELAVVPAVAGALSFRVRVPGLSAHGALREEGVSAIEKLPLVHAALRELERRRNEREADPLFDWLKLPFAICAGRVAGGDWPSSEADWLVLDGRYGVAPGESLDAARDELEAAVAGAAALDPWLAAHPPTVEWWGGQYLPARTAVDAPIVRTLADAVDAARGEPAALRGMPYGCDMGLITRLASVPTVVFGPGDIRDAHRPDEHVEVADLVACARALALTIVRTCGSQ